MAFAARLNASLLREPDYRKHFAFWEDHGFHLVPLHFESPIPDTRNLPRYPWQHESKLRGIEMNEQQQVCLLTEEFPRFRHEYSAFPAKPGRDEAGFYLENGMFEGVDPLVLHCMVRRGKPNLIVEVGGGFSTLVSAAAAAKNGNTRLICIDPFPPAYLTRKLPARVSLVAEAVQEVGCDIFDALESGDILFIDSSHVAKYGSDVTYLFLEVLPRLKPGVVVHVHDIFLPADYLPSWLTDRRLFYNEQYLLQAFLAFNSAFEVLLANSYLTHYHLDKLKATFPTAAPYPGGASLWMRRTR